MATLIKTDLEFILQQILIAEKHATGANLSDLLPNTVVPFGLRTVDGSFNNLIFGRTDFGAADLFFPRLLSPAFRNDQDGDAFDANGPAPGGLVTNTNYAVAGNVADADPRTISNLIVDQTANNPAAVAAAAANPGSQVVTSPGLDGVFSTADDRSVFFIPNVAPDVGLSAPFNSWMTFFGQFFDHGLDLVTKGGSGTVFIPLQPDDPLFVPGSPTNFMVVTRATNAIDPVTGQPIHEHQNTTSPFVDQNQTYSSHPSHQVFLRAYELNAAGDPVATGKLIVNRILGADGQFGTADDVVTGPGTGGMATWAVVKAQARDLLGINLTDADVLDVPLLATDAYGNFLRGSNGFPQVVIRNPDGTTSLLEGDPAANGGLGISLTNAVRTGHAFLNDIAHAASPVNGQTGAPLGPDSDSVVGLSEPGTYDNELLDAHFIAGDGRVNENIGLTAVHAIFHSEHNRLVEHTKDVVLADAQQLVAGGATQAEAIAFLNNWLAVPVAGITALTTKADLTWNGERLFQVAKFGTEMQYQHLVFEEFARKVQPQVDAFLAPEGFDATINPAIVAEFAHTVYRFGHSMLTETVDRYDPNFNVVGDGDPTLAGNQQTGLIAAFLNPLAFAASGVTPEQAAGAIVRGVTRQAGNEIDEFVTEALRNNLVGLPLDLAAINIARGRDTGIPSLNAARRQFYAMTGDSQLKPYTSWADLVQYLKHPESLVNFIAAYGTHPLITAATTMAAMRAAATELVFGVDQNGDGIVAADRLDFLNSTGAWASGANGVTITGLDAIDFWIGGLAEEKMPFGGMLGATFNFVFETQMEALQNGDRFYYLSRLAGLNFLTELENNSFAKLVMLNTDATHLPADIFSTPGFILEVDPSKQFNASVIPGPDGILLDNPLTLLVNESADNLPGNADPVGGSALIPLVIRDNPATPGADTNFLRYTGEDHVVLGGTPGADIVIASIGDDTLWGDAGNDSLEGGYGNDNIEGGDGDDIITDIGGDDVLKGNAGNDVISGGNGFNLILGGDGSDFIITGEDVSETFGGPGNDFILGAQMNLPTFGNEGDDWIEIGTSDGAAGDNFAPLEDGTIPGNDVAITGGGFDEFDGEGGDDIMVMSDGEDHFGGGGGFDWASYKNDPLGVTVDMNVNDFIEPPVAPSNQGLLDRFAQVEGLSGSAFSDVLRGDDADLAAINLVGPQNSALTNFDLIAGLRAFLGTAAAGPDGILGNADDSFASGNILLGGGGSDIIEGRGGNDVIDGDRWLNVRVAVSGHPTITTVDSLTELIPFMLSGEINPSQLSIVREINTAAAAFDTAMYSDLRINYDIQTVGGVTTVTHLVRDGDGIVIPGAVGADGVDRLTNIERLQFSPDPAGLTQEEITGVVGLPSALVNNNPVGSLTISGVPSGVLTASAAGVTDADNPGAITGPISFVWQFETAPGSGIFQDIVAFGGGNPATAHGNTFRVTPDLAGANLRVRAVYQDANGVLENVFSAPTGPAVAAPLPAPANLPAESPTVSPGGGIHLIRADLQFMLDQILIAEAHSGAYGTPAQDLLSLLPNSRLPFGLRTVDGSLNNLVQGQTDFGAADQNFPLLLDQQFRNEGDEAPFAGVTNTNFAALNATNTATVNVVDSDPRIISNLIVDQTISNPSAVQAFVDAGLGTIDPVTGALLDLNGVAIPAGQSLFIPNVAPDEGLSAPFNGWFTFFGQFFDHGLDLVNKGGNGVVFVPLQPDDPLITVGRDGIAGTGDELTNPAQQFMVLTRATNTLVQAGADNILGTADDVHLHNNQTTPFVDQNQTYTSHPSHQVFLREYALNAAGRPVATGQMLDGADGGLPTWADVKAQALMLGIILTDADITNLPMLATDPYGKFLPGANGLAQFVTATGTVAGVAGGLAVPGNVIRTNHAFLDDIAHSANPRNSQGALLTADADTIIGDDGNPATYDNELLDRHFITGDGRGNENIGLTTVHHVFHSEHNRMVQHIKDVVIASNDPAFIAQWQLPDGSWNGERLFQAARFSTEMQYQHLVFEEFARKIQPQVDVFLQEGQGYDSTINPAIVAEFAHVVYRFGHTLLTETVNRLDPNFVASDVGLIEAFLNPIAFNNNGALTADQAAGAIVRGMTRQAGNEIDEFVTGALRNNLVGLPLDLATINLARGRDTGVPSLNAARLEFFNATGDTQLKPYTSWVDFAMNLKHESSIVNFIAAYGTHASITGATTIADKRAAAMELVFGGGAVSDVERLAFLNGPAATTGVNDIDLWIGGLAERQMPFGGLLGSTFNFVFENQMEKLQNGDRFYYLERTAGLNFLTELENNSFAKLIMANTDATHLPGDVFSTPGFILEVDPLKQFTGLNEAGPDLVQGTLDDVVGADGKAGNSDPAGGILLTPWVIRNNPLTAGPDTNYLKYTGDQHVVLGGTGGNDIIVSSEGDDTLYGDGGNDRLEGGYGNDMILGGVGDDILTDLGGDDNIQGGDGNDAIQGGNGLDLLLGGFGNDFIVTGEDGDETFGGTGNDFILGDRADEMVFGNEGDDWIELGTGDGSAGENFDTRGLDAIIGHDVFIGEGTIDRMLGEGGDDIMAGNGGPTDRYIGSSGFDWGVFKDNPAGANVDMRLTAFNEAPLPASTGSVLARFESTEGLSGSAFSDILQGDDRDAAMIAASGFTGSVLTHFDLISGLRAFVGTAAAGPDAILGNADDQFSAGNIILGGDGSDLIYGHGGNDLIDGDRWLNVRISVRANADGTGAEIASANSMKELAPRVMSGEINPGQLVIVREILTAAGPDFDTAVFSDIWANYVISAPDAQGQITVSHLVLGAAGPDGTDRLSNIERLQFADRSVELVAGINTAPVGLVALSDSTPEVGQIVTASIGNVTDPDNARTDGVITGPVSFFWQFDPGTGVFEDIMVPLGIGMGQAIGPTFTPTPDLVGLRLRVMAQYKDQNGVPETVPSASTAPVTDVVANDAPVLITDRLAAVEDTPITYAAAALLGNDLDAESNPLSIASVTSGAGGTAVRNADGSVSFTPNADFNRFKGLATFTYTATDGVLTSAVPGNVTVNVTPVNDLPVISSPLAISDTTPTAGQTPAQVLTATAAMFTDADGTTNPNAVPKFQWQSSANGVTWTPIAGATSLTFTPGQAQVGLLLRLVQSYTDDQGTLEQLVAATSVVGNLINGTAAANTLTGTAGDDIINGLGGNDILDGGAGADTMVGGRGNDTFIVDNPLDVVTELPGQGLDTVRTTLSNYTLGANIEILTFITGTSPSAAPPVGITGIGNALKNTLRGGVGNDTLDGGLGIDRLIGEGGNDTYFVDHRLDKIVEQGGGGIDTVHATCSSYTLRANVENLIYDGTGNFVGTGNGLANTMTGGAGNDTLRGRGGNDTLNGAAGNDKLLGGAGADILNGGAGNDIMNGGAGGDVFVFTAGFGADRINRFDFNPAGGQDLLDISALGVTAASFGTEVSITDLGSSLSIAIGGDTILLAGVGNPASVTQDDFLLAA